MRTFISRRDALLGATAASLAWPAAAQITAANVAAPRFAIEPNARLRVLRPAKFVDPDEQIFNDNARRFTAATGVEVRVDYINWPDVPVQVGVAFNTGQGPDVIIGFGADPHLFADKVSEVSDVAEYLGAKYGGWYPLAELYGKRWRGAQWLAVPMGGSTGPVLFRESKIREAGFDSIPNDLGRFLELCRGLKRIGSPCGLALSRAPGDAPGYAHWLLWSHGGALVDEEGRVTLDSPETLRAMDYARAMQETMIPGTMSWDGASNNRAFISGQIGLTQNGVSVYYALKNAADAQQAALAPDTNHALSPFGVAPKVPQSALALAAMVPRYTRVPNAAKAFLAFMMEVEQYDRWLTGCLGYWSQPLRAYAESAVWRLDPKIDVFKHGLDTPFHDGWRGPVSAAAASVAANWVIVDMFARVVTGQQNARDSARDAQRAAQRWYRSG